MKVNIKANTKVTFLLHQSKFHVNSCNAYVRYIPMNKKLSSFTQDECEHNVKQYHFQMDAQQIQLDFYFEL